MWWPSFCLMVLMICASGCSKQPTSASGISQFWTDDYKVFDQVYGKTSDKDLYGATLPPSVAYGIDAAKLKQQASEKKERYLENHQNSYLGEEDPYGFGTRYPSLTNHGVIKSVNPPKITQKFIPADFKPIISKNTDPETYEYLKHLELLQNKKQKFLLQNAGGFKPYLTYGAGGVTPEDAEGYRSIQDILEAHEANKGKVSDDETDDQVQYLNHSPKHRGPVKKVKPPVPLNKGKSGKPPCPSGSGRCRKRATVTYRGRTYLTRPMVRKIKKVYYH